MVTSKKSIGTNGGGNFSQSLTDMLGIDGMRSFDKQKNIDTKGVRAFNGKSSTKYIRVIAL